MDLVRSRVPRIDQTLSRFGKERIADYLEQVLGGPFPPPLQEREDLFLALLQQTERLMGRETAERMVGDLRNAPVISTINHMGVDFTAHTLQGNLLFAIGNRGVGKSLTTIPVLSCGNIPLNNSTFPKGALIYKVPEENVEDVPVKVPLFPKRFNTRMVHVIPPFTLEMVAVANKRFKALVRDKKISPDLEAPWEKLLNGEYAAPGMLAQRSYSDQACLLNKIIFRDLFKEECKPPELVFINMEEIVITLLKKDLKHPRSLVHDLFFTPRLLAKIFTRLSGFRGCWEKELLSERMNVDYNDLDPSSKNRLKGCGTMLFWGISPENRRVPLCLFQREDGTPELKGKDECGKLFRVDFTAPSLIRAMEEKRLIPSNFTCFLVISFARGILCVGGYFQSEYLPMIRDQLVLVLERSGDERLVKSSETIAALPCDRFFSAMAGVMCGNKTGQLFPAGALSMLANPLSVKDIAKIQDLTVEQAFYASLLDTVMDVIPRNLLKEKWKGPLSFALGKMLENRVVVV